MSGWWMDLADPVGPTPNETPGGMQAVYGLCLHIQQGNEAGSIEWCENPASAVSAHFFAPKAGRMAQLVSVSDRAWAEANGNPDWISVELEGYSGQSLTDAQVDDCAHLLARLHVLYGVPLLVCDDPTAAGARGLTGHGLGGASWGGHFDCPGQPVLNQRQQIINRAAVLLASQGGPMTLTDADLTAIKLAVWGYENPRLDSIDMRQDLVNAVTEGAATKADVEAIKADVEAIKAKLGA